MTSLLRLRVLLPLAALCLSGALSDENLSPSLKKEDPQGDEEVDLHEAETGHAEKSFECYEDDLRFSPIIERDSWDERKNTLATSLLLDYVVVRDGGKQCQTHAECLASLSSELKNTSNSVCRTLDNFYIGGDGEVYEGRGWHVAPYWHLNGMRRKAVTVKFLGNHGSEGPSERVMRAFWRMAKTGVWEAKLSPDYKVLSMGQVLNDTTLVGNALEKVFQESSVGVKEFSLVTTWETTPDKSLPLITREEWGARKPSEPMTELGYGVKYVMINEEGERCYTPEECKSRIKVEQEQQLPIYGDLVDNFYIGDDGYVYEGRGYSYKPLWDMEIENEDSKVYKDEYMTVRFFGNFQSDLPSEKAIGALKLLVNAAISIHRIPSNYRLYSLRGIYNYTRFLGDGFFGIARKWTPWANNLDDRLAKEPRDEKGFIGMVKRADWEAKLTLKQYEIIKHPVDYVIINDHSGSDRCISSKECVSVMKEIREKYEEGYGDVLDNFYVADRGSVYEGRGWNIMPQIQPKYFNRSLITVSFIGNHNEVGASLPALAAFDKLVSVGVKLGKIIPNYQLYSFRNVYNADSLLGVELKKVLEKKKEWATKLDTLTESDRLNSGLLPIVPYSEWMDTAVTATYHSYDSPIKFVVIGNAGERCFNHSECEGTMKKLHKSGKNDLSDNFYIGDDGMAYEGRGWTFAPNIYFKYLKSEFYYISFLGKYGEENVPSNLSILALNRLLMNGVRTQKLSSDFKIISVHQIFDSDIASKDPLYKAIKTWDRWTSDFSIIPDVETTSFGQSVFIRRADWKAEKPLVEIPALKHPVSYVVVHNVGDHCSDLASCIKSMQTIQKNTPQRYWDVPDNFYVGDDGHIYEGRGWSHSSLWGTKGIEYDILSVGFLGTSESTLPSPKALLAFYILQQTGIISGRLAPDFRTISLGEIIQDNVVVTENLVGVLNVSGHWSDEFQIRYDRARLRSLTSPFVLSDEWNIEKQPIRMSSELTKPLAHIAIRDGGESCGTNETCVARIRKEHNDRHASSDNGVGENFYVGNDGNVYEGVGWDWDMVWGFSGWRSTVSVQFFGNYQESLPSANAIEAFNTVIIRDGIATGKLSPDYKIVPIPVDEGRTLGSKLREEIMTWKNAADEI